MINKIEYTILDGNLGNSAGFAESSIAVIGVGCNPGEIKTLTSFENVEEIFGKTPIRDFLAQVFSLNKKPTVYALSIQPIIGGVISWPVENKTGIGTVTISGSPLNAFNIKITIIKKGGLNEATFYYTINGVDSKEFTVPDNGVFELTGTGLTVTFNPETPEPNQVSFDEYDEFSFTTTAPKATNSQILSSIETLLNSKKPFSIISVVGETDKSLWTAVNTMLENEAERNNFKIAIFEARYKRDNETTDQYVDALIGNERPTGSLKRVQVVALHTLETEPTGASIIRSPVGKYVAHLAAICSPQERPGKVKLGAIPALSKIYPVDITDAHLSALDDAGYVTPVTYYGIDGVFFSRGRLMTELTSDFKCVPERRVLDKALTLVYERQLRYLNDDVMVSKKDGSPEGLNYFKADSCVPLKQMLRDKEISDYELIIPEGQNILSSETLEFELAIVPKGYLGILKAKVYYKNPALTMEG